MKTMKDYQDLHLKCDALLLVDVLEKFGNSIFKSYGLCPSRLFKCTSFKLGCNT